MTTVEATSYEQSLDEDTVSKWFKTFRTITSRLIETRLNVQLGGPEDIIEIDECQIGRRKHHRGRERNEVWLLGMIVRGSNPPSLFIQDVKKRNRETLEPIIQRHVNRCSRIFTDGWRAYRRLNNLGFRHSVVVHERNFVAPEDPNVHTQNVENLWRCLRRFLNRRCAYRRKDLMSYVREFMFRKVFIDPFETLISAISEQTMNE